MREMHERDEYRVTLFKKKLREILGAPWVRFYNSKGRCHLCIDSYQVGRENIELIRKLLVQARIDHSVTRDPFGLHDDKPESERQIWTVNIPVDQEALPERRRPLKQEASEPECPG